jgi:glycerophosphoryl diester phosphodiesterase
VDVVAPLARAITEAGATDRVLITSFSGSRRRRTLALLPGVATSASADVVVPVVLLCALGMPIVARWVFQRTRILQIPTTVLRINVASPRMLSRLHHAGFIVQFWTINSVDEMRQLVHAGADGIVTDRCDLAAEAFRQR